MVYILCSKKVNHWQNDLLERNQQFCNYIQEYIPEKISSSNSKLVNAQKNDETCQSLIKPFGKYSETSNNNESKISWKIQTNIKIINNVLYVQRDIKEITS